MDKNPENKQHLASIRNIGIIAHIDAGKTTLSERFLYYSGKTHRIGDIDDGTTVLDYLDEERRRGITIVAAAASFQWNSSGQHSLIHLIDTPGHIDFTAEVERSLRVADGAVVIFSGVEGVEAQSEKVWRQSDHYHVPKIAFVNKMDRLGASFGRVLADIKAKFSGTKAVAVQLPMGQESELKGVIDLLTMQALYFEGEDGSELRAAELPQEFMETSLAAREEFMSTIAELSDEVAEFYLSEQEVPLPLVKKELRRLVIANKLCPIFTGSAKRNIGVQPVLDAIIDYLPSPADCPLSHGHNPKDGEPLDVSADDPNFCGLIFKVVASGSADLLYMRSYSGQLTCNDTVLNPRTKEKIRIKRILRLYAKNVEPLDSVGPGDIVGLIGPQNVGTGDTLCAVNRPVLLERIEFPEPVISMALEPKTSKDKDRLDACLALLCREDPTLSLAIHENTGQRLLSGMGELHLEINTNRIKSEFNLDIRCGAPQVAFRETLREPCTVTGIFDKTLGDNTYYAEADISLEPVPRLEKGLEVSLALKSRQGLPNSWCESAHETLSGGLRTGGNWGYPLFYIRAAVTAIRGTQEKTTEAAVAGAVLDALQKAISSGTVLLEPLMRLEIISPENVIGEITGYLQSRRAVIHGIENLPGIKKLSCEVPLAEMFGFSKALPKLSGGRAAFSMEPCGYQEISPADLERLVNR